MEQEELADKEAVARIEARIAQEPRHRRALYRLLDFCTQVRSLDEIEQETASYPEMAVDIYAPRTLLMWLLDCGAVGEVGSDDPQPEQGDSANEEAEEEEGADYRFVTTDAGIRALERLHASQPLAMLAARYPYYEAAFLRVLAACETPQSRQDIDGLFKGDPIMESPRKIYANFFLDKLEGAGGIVFAGGWTTTPEGKAFLAQCAEGSSSNERGIS